MNATFVSVNNININLIDMKKVKQIALSVLGMAFIAAGFVACSSDDSSAETNTQMENSMKITASDFDWSRLGRFDIARRSRFCRNGFGICTMKDVDDARAEEKRIQEELERLEERNLGLRSEEGRVGKECRFGRGGYE